MAGNRKRAGDEDAVDRYRARPTHLRALRAEQGRMAAQQGGELQYYRTLRQKLNPYFVQMDENG